MNKLTQKVQEITRKISRLTNTNKPTSMSSKDKIAEYKKLGDAGKIATHKPYGI